VVLSIYRPDGLVGLFQRRAAAVPTVDPAFDTGEGAP